MKITVTAGHGGSILDGFGWRSDPGAERAGLREAELMAELRDMVAARLRADGHQVRTDGDGKVNRALTYAMQLIAGADAAIELHTNAFDDERATGVEVVALERLRAPAQRIARAIANATGQRLRGEAGWIDQSKTARGKNGFVRSGGMVVEVFFLSNPRDRETYLACKESIAFAIARAVAGQPAG